MDRLNRGMAFILVQGNYGAASCASRHSWINDNRSSLKGLVCVKKTGYFSRIMLQFTLLVGNRIFLQANNIRLLDHLPCSLDEPYREPLGMDDKGRS